MTKGAALTGSALFFIVAPCFIAGLVPWWISHWYINPPLLGVRLFRLLGWLLIAAGICGILESFARLRLKEPVLPRPALPTESLVISGLYVYVRNPMYVAVMLAVLSQGILLSNTRLLIYGVVLFLLFHAFVRLYEEPSLRKRFGAQYDRYCARVPRWIPRLRT